MNVLIHLIKRQLLLLSFCTFNIYAADLEHPKKRKCEKKVTFNDDVEVRYFEKDLIEPPPVQKDPEKTHLTVFWDHAVDEILINKNGSHKAKKSAIVYFVLNDNKARYPVKKLNKYCPQILEKRSEECSFIKNVIKTEKVTLFHGEKIYVLSIAIY